MVLSSWSYAPAMSGSQSVDRGSWRPYAAASAAAVSLSFTEEVRARVQGFFDFAMFMGGAPPAPHLVA